MAKKIVFGNFKGGTGKTTNSTMISYHIAKKGYKTLLVDIDPQANATSLLLLTAQNQQKKVIPFETTLMNAIYNKNMKNVITQINEKLFLLPSASDFTAYPLYLETMFPYRDGLDLKRIQEERNKYLMTLIKEIEDDYDYIIFDIPPTLSVYTDSAVLASDYVVIVMQTHERSLVGAEAFIEYLQNIYDQYNYDFDILGVLAVLLKNNAIVDQSVLENSKNTFGEKNMFKNIVTHMERLKRYDIIGIKDPDIDEDSDIHDKRVHELYKNVTEEVLERIKVIEGVS